MMITAEVLISMGPTARPTKGLRSILVKFFVAAVEFRLELLFQFVGLVDHDVAPPEPVAVRVRRLPRDELKRAFVFAAIFAGAVRIDPGSGHVDSERGFGDSERPRAQDVVAYGCILL
jgi:hypothetical protein